MNLVWIENARAALVRIYGEKRGARVCAAVMPGVMGDFRKMLTAAEDGAPVREDYRIDDLKADIHIEGVKKGGTLFVTRLDIGGQTIELGADALRL